MEVCRSCHQNIKYATQRDHFRCSVCNGMIHKECGIPESDKVYCDYCYVAKSTVKEVTYTVPEVIRRSYIELYRKCPYDFYWQIIRGFMPPNDIYQLIGQDLHHIFEEASYALIPKTKAIQMFNDFFNGYKEELFSDTEFKEKMHKRGITCINNFYELLATLPDRPFATERTIQFSVGEALPRVSITFDRIDLVDGMLEIHDYKTGGVMVGKQISHDLQAPLYIQAVKTEYNLPIRKFNFHYLNEGKIRTFERIDEMNYACQVRRREYFINLNEGIKEVQRVFQKIKRGDFNVPTDTKSMYWQCNNCIQRAEGRCRGAEEEVWYQK